MEENETDEEWDDIWNLEGARYENVVPDMFCTKPIDGRIEPLLGAFAKALGSMPSLEEAELFTYLSWGPNEKWEEEYPNPPLDREMRKYRWGVSYLAGGSSGRLGWQVGVLPGTAGLRHLKNRARYTMTEVNFVAVAVL